MSTDLFKTVNYNDGEGLSFGDQNDSQRFLAARLNDQILEKLISKFDSVDPDSVRLVGADSSTAWAYCLDVTAGMPFQGSANNKIKIGAGTLFQKIANATGDEPTLLAYTFDGTTELTIANGDATNPRVDMIQMALAYVTDDLQSRDFEDGTTHVVTTTSMNKKRQVQATINIKSSTAAANPTYPTPDTGYVPIACVVVDATYTSASGGLTFNDWGQQGPSIMLHDLRMPVNVKPHHLTPSKDGVFPSAQWTADTVPANAGHVTNAATTGTAPDNELWLYHPKRKGRLLGVSVASANAASAASGNAWLSFIISVGSGTSYGRLVDISTLALNTGIPANGDGPKIAKMSDIEKSIPITAPSSGSTSGFATHYTVNGNGTHAPPIWANGERSYYEQQTFQGNVFTGYWLKRMAVSFKAQALDIYGVVLYFAEGI